MFAENLNKEIQNIKEEINRISPIKSIQRGTCSLGTSGSDITVTINKINIDKAMVLLQGAGYNSDSISSTYIRSSIGVYISNISDSSFVISQHTSSTNSKSISWQVIEFY